MDSPQKVGRFAKINTDETPPKVGRFATIHNRKDNKVSSIDHSLNEVNFIHATS